MLILITNSNKEAFEILYNRYFERLCRSVYKRIPHETTVEELVQDVFVNVWSKRTRLDTSGNIGAYLYATLRNKALHELRARLIIEKHTQQLQQSDLKLYADDLQDQINVREVEQRIRIIVNELPPQCREAFTLSRFEHLSYKMIAERMNISVNTVEKHIGKALHILRSELREYDMPLVLLVGFAQAVVQ